MSPPRPVRAIAFDMDGLLLDSETLFRDALFDVADARGIDFPQELFLSMVGLPGATNRVQVSAHFGASFDYDDFILGVKARFRVLAPNRLTLKPGADALINASRNAGLPVALVTSSGRETAEYQLDLFGLFSKFDAVVAGGEAARGKPWPDPYLEAARRLEIDPVHCLAFEDSHNGVRAAHAAGMMTVMVPDLLPPTDEIAALCAAVIPTLEHAMIWVRP